ncbi:MAG: hypothetical protein ACLQIB_14540 [Isosphaeraceae bacterium]
MMIGGLLSPLFGWINNESAEWLIDGVETAICTLLLVLPELLLATF